MSYLGLAAAYDELMYDTDYDAWAAHICALLGANGVQPGDAVLECACGTGNLTLRLLAAGYDVTAGDIDDAMLSEAAKKLRSSGYRVPLLLADMAALDGFDGRFRAVVAACDAVNYLDGGGLAAFFSGAYAALLPGGALTFDACKRERLSEMDGVSCDESETCAYIMRGSFDGRTLETDVSVYLRQPDGKYIRSDSLQTMHLHEADDIVRLLGDAGFINITADGRCGAITPLRTQFTAIKGDNNG